MKTSVFFRVFLTLALFLANQAGAETSIAEISEILLSEKIYEGRLNNANPWTIDAQVSKILAVNTTPEEKEVLWNLFLYRNMAFVTLWVNEFNQFTHATADRPDTLHTEFQKPTFVLKDLLGASLLGCCFGWVAMMFIYTKEVRISLGNGYERRDRVFRNPKEISLKWQLLSVGLGAASTTLLNLSVQKDAVKKREAQCIELTEQIISFYTNSLSTLTKKYPLFPKHFLKEWQETQELLAQIPYKIGDTANAYSFSKYLEIVYDYHKKLGERAGLHTSKQ